MAVESSTKINLGKAGEFRIASASKGLACTTTAKFQQFPLKSTRLIATARNFADSAVVVRLLFNPWLVVLKTIDNMVGTPTDYSEAAQDNSTSTSVILSSLSTRANGDFMLVGSHLPFRGVYFDVDDTNATSGCTGSVYYWNGSAWITTGATMSGVTSATFLDQDGIVTWSVPSAWKPEKLNKLYPNTPPNAYSDIPLYWTRWETDKALEASVTIDAMSAANRSTAYAEIASGQAISIDIEHGIGGIGCIEALTDTGTANLIINAISKGKFQ